jgi:hypothetical protein
VELALDGQLGGLRLCRDRIHSDGASDGSIWFTDPIYGIGGNYEGIKQQPE